MSRRYVRFLPVVTLTVCALLGLNVRTVSAANIALSFSQDGGYDNTANVVNAGPTPVNNQTHGDWRDVYWWSINNGQPRVGSPDFINRGNSLVLCGISACEGSGPYTALNFTGPSVGGGQAYISVYDTNEKAPGHTNFDITAEPLTISTDILFVKHSVSAGIISMYDDTTGDGLALLAHNGDGTNPDSSNVKLIFQNAGVGMDLIAPVVLPSGSFCTASDGGLGCTPGDHWYRVVLNLSYLGGGIVDVNGDIYNHSTPSNPNSGLGSLIVHLDYTGSIAANNLSNPGQIGAVVLGNEAIALPDNVGVSFFDAGTAVPEPSSIMLLGTGLLGIARLYQRKRR